MRQRTDSGGRDGHNRLDHPAPPYRTCQKQPRRPLLNSATAPAYGIAETVLLKTGALQSAILNSASLSLVATDTDGVIRIFNIGAERMLGYTAADVLGKLTLSDFFDREEVIARARTLSGASPTPIQPGFEALVFKAAQGIEDIFELTYRLRAYAPRQRIHALCVQTYSMERARHL